MSQNVMFKYLTDLYYISYSFFAQWHSRSEFHLSIWPTDHTAEDDMNNTIMILWLCTVQFFVLFLPWLKSRFAYLPLESWSHSFFTYPRNQSKISLYSKILELLRHRLPCGDLPGCPQQCPVRKELDHISSGRRLTQTPQLLTKRGPRPPSPSMCHISCSSVPVVLGDPFWVTGFVFSGSCLPFVCYFDC